MRETYSLFYSVYARTRCQSPLDLYHIPHTEDTQIACIGECGCKLIIVYSLSGASSSQVPRTTISQMHFHVQPVELQNHDDGADCRVCSVAAIVDGHRYYCPTTQHRRLYEFYSSAFRTRCDVRFDSIRSRRDRMNASTRARSHTAFE